MSDLITSAEINSGIGEAHRPYFLVATAELRRPCLPVIEALWCAIEHFAPSARLKYPVHVLMSTAPFHVPLSNGTLTFAPHDGVINIAVENLVFLDVVKMLAYPKEIQVACIIEEFVHSLMNVADEQVTSHIVTLLYPRVVVVDGKYTVAS